MKDRRGSDLIKRPLLSVRTVRPTDWSEPSLVTIVNLPERPYLLGFCVCCVVLVQSDCSFFIFASGDVDWPPAPERGGDGDGRGGLGGRAGLSQRGPVHGPRLVRQEGRHRGDVRLNRYNNCTKLETNGPRQRDLSADLLPTVGIYYQSFQRYHNVHQEVAVSLLYLLVAVPFLHRLALPSRPTALVFVRPDAAPYNTLSDVLYLTLALARLYEPNWATN